MESIWAVILAAGHGTRAGLKGKNKVTLKLQGEPIIKKTVDILISAGIKNIVVVVGFEKNSVIKVLGKRVAYVEQKQRLGTAHAVKTALKVIPKGTKNVMVMYGDDSYSLTREVIKHLVDTHKKSKTAITFLTTELENPNGAGRILRDKDGGLLEIVEEKDATEKTRKIKEVNLAFYIFSRDFLSKSLPKIKKSKVTNEYYLTSIIEEAVKLDAGIHALKVKDYKWRGINTIEEFKEAKKLHGSV